jgi:sarcosine oxidase subunit delta
VLLIKCPWCGERAESEFSYGGEAGIARPLKPDELSDAEWADYLFHRKNPRGAHQELWNHAQGCRRWFEAERDTVSYEIAETREL